MGSDLSKPKAMQRCAFRDRSKKFFRVNRNIEKPRKLSLTKSIIHTNVNDSNIVITHKYPPKSTKSLPNSPTLYHRFNDLNKYDTIITNRNIYKKDDPSISPFYYDVAPGDIYVTENKLIHQPKVVKKLIYGTADDLNKCSSYERIIEFNKHDHSPINTTRSRIYSQQDINNSNKLIDKPKVPKITQQKHITNNSIGKSPVNVYRNTENIFYIPGDISPGVYYKSHKNLIDSLNTNDIYVYDDIQSPVKPIYPPQRLISPRTIANRHPQLNPIQNNNLNSNKILTNDDEIVYVPMKKSDFLKKGVPSISSTENNKNNQVKQMNNQGEYMVLKEKTIHKPISLHDKKANIEHDNNNNTYKNSMTNIPITIESNFKNYYPQAFPQINTPQGIDNKKVNLTIQTNKQSNNIPPVPPPPPPPPMPKHLFNNNNNQNIPNRNNMSFDPLMYKRYQLTPTDSNIDMSEKKESSSKVMHPFELKNNSFSKLKNPLSGLFEYSMKKIIRKIQ